MKSVNEPNFERRLPAGYKQALYINAKDAKLGLLLNGIALIVLVIVMAAAMLSLSVRDQLTLPDIEYAQLLTAYIIFLASMVGYIILHELVHGMAYKVLTGEKLTFGISWSCAFCGVPDIFTYRRTALIAVIAPFTVFTVLFVPVLIFLYFVNPLYYLMAAFLFGLHVGGCSGDLYIWYLLMTKFRHPGTLMRDTGPEQFFYVPETEQR